MSLTSRWCAGQHTEGGVTNPASGDEGVTSGLPHAMLELSLEMLVEATGPGRWRAEDKVLAEQRPRQCAT